MFLIVIKIVKYTMKVFEHSKDFMLVKLIDNYYKRCAEKSYSMALPLQICK